MTARRIPLLLTLAASIGLGAARAHAGISVLNGLSHERVAQPGESYDGEVTIANNADRVAQVRVYQTDYTFDASGTASYDAIGTLERSSGRWVTVGAPGVVTLGPRQQATLPYTVTVPVAESLGGTYWSVLMIEEVPASVLDDVRTEPALGIRNVMRYAIQLVTHIGDTGEEDFRVAAMRLEAKDAAHLGLLLVDLENVGETLLRAELRCELFDAEGRAVGAHLASRKRLYPGTSARFVADLTEVPLGAYKMVMMVRMASGSVYASEYVLAPAT
jgi:hypothetical protein